jgi:hypothetical protein
LNFYANHLDSTLICSGIIDPEEQFLITLSFKKKKVNDFIVKYPKKTTIENIISSLSVDVFQLNRENKIFVLIVRASDKEKSPTQVREIQISAYRFDTETFELEK